MTVNQLIKKLKSLQATGYGNIDVHIIAHDNLLGETQGEVCRAWYYKKEEHHRDNADHPLYDSTPEEMVYLGY